MPFDGANFEHGVAQLFEAMLEFLGPNGERWTCGTLLDKDGNRCLIGAMRHCRAKLRMNGGDKAAYCLRKAIRHHLNGEASDIMGFNDILADSFEDVRAVLVRARDSAFGKESPRYPREQLKLPIA